MAAEAENKDNLAEQTRQHGKRVRYGEIVHLKHIFLRQIRAQENHAQRWRAEDH